LYPTAPLISSSRTARISVSDNFAIYALVLFIFGARLHMEVIRGLFATVGAHLLNRLVGRSNGIQHLSGSHFRPGFQSAYTVPERVYLSSQRKQDLFQL
jgi:hypothetical protein